MRDKSIKIENSDSEIEFMFIKTDDTLIITIKDFPEGETVSIGISEEKVEKLINFLTNRLK
jgi:hypothetical protein